MSCYPDAQERMPLVVSMFSTAPGAATHSVSDVVAPTAAGGSGATPSGGGGCCGEGFNGPGSCSEVQPVTLTATTGRPVPIRRDCRSRSSPTPVLAVGAPALSLSV